MGILRTRSCPKCEGMSGAPSFGVFDVEVEEVFGAEDDLYGV